MRRYTEDFARSSQIKFLTDLRLLSNLNVRGGHALNGIVEGTIEECWMCREWNLDMRDANDYDISASSLDQMNKHTFYENLADSIWRLVLRSQFFHMSTVFILPCDEIGIASLLSTYNVRRPSDCAPSLTLVEISSGIMRHLVFGRTGENLGVFNDLI